MEQESKVLQVWGLPRSGTNFVEYLFRYNTNAIINESFSSSPYIEIDPCALKHCKPQPGADINIFIYKGYQNWLNSFCKWTYCDPTKSRLIYINSTSDYLNFIRNNQNSYSVRYEDLLGNEKDFLQYVCNENGLTLRKVIEKPNFKLSRDSGRTQTAIPFFFDIGKSPMSKELDHIKTLYKISWKK